MSKGLYMDANLRGELLCVSIECERQQWVGFCHSLLFDLNRSTVQLCCGAIGKSRPLAAIQVHAGVPKKRPLRSPIPPGETTRRVVQDHKASKGVVTPVADSMTWV